MVAAAEERKRGQRLFGGLLGALSQSSATSAQKRRADIEQRQQAKLKLQDEQHSETKRRKKEELVDERRRQQKELERASVCFLLADIDVMGADVFWLDDCKTSKYATSGWIFAHKGGTCFGGLFLVTPRVV